MPVFTGPVYGTYRASLGAAQQRGRRLRVVLRLTAPELAALPWEMLFDPETETYLCRKEPLVRHVHAPYTAEPLEVQPPLRVLGLIASPRDLPSLDVDAEKHRLAEALADPIAQGLIDVTWVSAATWPAVHAQLLAGQWHVLHFVGHGTYDTAADEGRLALVGADGRADLVEASRLADLLGEAQPTPRLVVLNSCSSGQVGTNDLFSGTAAALVRSGISAVAAMQFTISDDAAIAFARGFYTALARGRDVDEAVRSGRISILGAPRSLEWVTPVLYLRGEASRLFTLAQPAGTAREASRGQQAIRADQAPAAARPAGGPADQRRRRQAELRALYIEACAELRLEHFGTAVGLFDDLLTLDPDYPDASRRRAIAERGRQLADAYASAAAAEGAGDWGVAAREYGEILESEPAYRDAAARKQDCERRQQVADLQAELRRHAGVAEWRAVLAVDSELARIDPAAADPDGLATRARAELAAVQEEADRRDLVARLRSELAERAAAGDWPQVLGTISELRDLDPDTAAEPSLVELAARARRELAGRAGPPLRFPGITGFSWNVYALCWHPDGRRIALASQSAIARVYDVSGAEPEQKLEVKAGNFFSWPVAVAFSPDGTRLATGARNNRARIWDTASGGQQLEIRLRGEVNAVAFSPDGTRLATASTDGTARISDAATGLQLPEFRHGKQVNTVAFSPDGTRVASGALDASIRIDPVP
jgi:tetratricopeptide (TPR) repeat protein